MRKFTKHPRVPVTASKADTWYICPECHNKTVVPMYPDNTPLVDEGEVFICNECGAEFEAHPLYNGEVKFTLPFGEYVQRHGPGGPDDLTDDDYDYWYSRWEAYVDSVKRRVTSTKMIKASTKKPMSFEEYCQATWGLSSSKLTSDDKKKAEEEYHRVTKQPVDSAKDATYKTDRRLSPTSVRYRGYLIVLDRGGDGYNIYDKYRELEDAGYSSVENAKKAVDEIISESGVTAAQDSDTYWMAKYTSVDGKQHKILFSFNSSDFSEAEEEMDAVIPEPYTRARLLGKAPNRSAAERDGFVVVGCDKAAVTASEDVDEYEDDIREISQEFTSENTSINSGKLPAIFKMIHLEPGTINIDYGGGKFDNVAEYLAPMDVVNLVYDPYNRTPEHNREVIRTIKNAGGADSATCSNVLNVIKEPEVRRNVLENIRRVVKPDGVVYITVYEGSGKGNEGPTKSGYQLNRRTADYLEEIKEVFPDAIRKGKLIIAHPSGGAVTSAVSLPNQYWESETDIEGASDVSNKDLMFLAKKAAEVTTAEDLEEIISSLLSVDKKLYTKYSEEARSDKSPAAIGKDISDDLYWKANSDSVTSASYGGAYDIADDDYFGKEELMEFGDSLEPMIQHLADDEDSGSQVYLSGVYLDNNMLTVVFTIDGAEHEGTVRIDKRRVRRIKDLYKYVTPLFEQIANSFWDYVQPEATEQQRKRWMDTWRTIQIPGYLSDLTSSYKVTGQPVQASLVETPQEVVNELIDILAQYDFILDPAFPTNPGKTWMGAVHLQVINETSHVPQDDFVALKDNVPRAMLDAIHDLEDRSNCPITWSFGVNESGQVTAGLDIMEQYIEDAETIMSATSISMKAIHDKILNAASKRMQKSDIGFPLSEIADYLIVEEEETEDGALKIEVRCELGYNSMRKLAEVLDPIVARYDKNAYFDMVAPGIMEAFIFNKKVTADTAAPIDASVYDFPEPPLEPPDYDDPEENESVEYITIDLDDDIIVEVDTVDFAGSPKFEKDEADWVVDKYPSIQLDYSEFVAENVLDLILPQLPAEPGIYRVRGRVHLAYDVMVPVYYESYSPDDEEYIVDDDNVEIDFNFKKSSIENLEVGKD